MFRFLESTGQEEQEATNTDRASNDNSARAAAVAAVVALALLSDKRKDMIVAYAAIEATIALLRETKLVPDVKYIGACAFEYRCQRGHAG